MGRLINTGREKILSKGRVNSGVQMAYAKALRILIRRMHRDVEREISAYYSRAAADLAQDRSPVAAINATLKKLRKKWTRIFSNQAQALASKFLSSNQNDSERDLQRRLHAAGFGIKFKPTRRIQQYISLATSENVSLIKSIPERYHDQVENIVVTAISNGGDIAALKQSLQKRFGITERRAALIAQDQTHKISQTVERLRSQELGIKEAVWQHVGGGRNPRADHVRANGKRYLIAEGCKISGEFIQPGQLINCHCRGRQIIPGYND